MQENREELMQSITEALQELNTEALELVITPFMQSMKDNEKYSIHTTEERLAKLKADDAAEERKRKSEKKYQEFLKKNRYTLNQTMIMLSNSYYWQSCCSGGEYYSLFKDVLKARPYETTMGAALDFFSLGMICGIRKERKRGKRDTE